MPSLLAGSYELSGSQNAGVGAADLGVDQKVVISVKKHSENDRLDLTRRASICVLSPR